MTDFGANAKYYPVAQKSNSLSELFLPFSLFFYFRYFKSAMFIIKKGSKNNAKARRPRNKVTDISSCRMRS